MKALELVAMASSHIAVGAPISLPSLDKPYPLHAMSLKQCQIVPVIGKGSVSALKCASL